MKLLKIVMVHLAVSAVIGVGIWLAVAKGNWWLFWIGLLGYSVLLGRACATN